MVHQPIVESNTANHPRSAPSLGSPKQHKRSYDKHTRYTNPHLASSQSSVGASGWDCSWGLLIRMQPAEKKNKTKSKRVNQDCYCTKKKKPPQSSHTQIPGSYLHGRHTHEARERDLGFRFPGHCGLCTESHLSPTSQLANPCAFVLDGGQFPVKLASPSTSRQTKTTHPKHNAIAITVITIEELEKTKINPGSRKVPDHNRQKKMPRTALLQPAALSAQAEKPNLTLGHAASTTPIPRRDP